MGHSRARQRGELLRAVRSVRGPGRRWPGRLQLGHQGLGRPGPQPAVVSHRGRSAGEPLRAGADEPALRPRDRAVVGRDGRACAWTRCRTRPAPPWPFGVQGLAPYWFEVEASAYVETSGRTHVRVETEYDLLLTNRLVLQPLVEFEIYGRADPERRHRCRAVNRRTRPAAALRVPSRVRAVHRRGLEPQVLRHRRLRGGGRRPYPQCATCGGRQVLAVAILVRDRVQRWRYDDREVARGGSSPP